MDHFLNAINTNGILLEWLFLSLVLCLLLLFQPSIIHTLRITSETRLKSIRLYFILLIVYVICIAFSWYIDSYVYPLSHIMYPFSTLLLFITLVFGIKTGLATFLITLPVILYYFVPPKYSIALTTDNRIPTIITTFALLFGVISGAVIRMYHQLLGNKLDELQKLYWQTRSRLATTTSEQEILQGIDKASLAVASGKDSLEHILTVIGNETKQLLGVHYVGIGLLQNDVFKSTVELSDMRKYNLTKDQSEIVFEIIEKVLKSKRLTPLVIDISKATQLLDNKKIYFLYNKILLAPIFLNNTILGCMFVTNHKDKLDFSVIDQKKISLFAAHAALAIQNAQRQEELKKLIRLRDQFASIASHELKTPLSAIKLYTQLLQTKLSNNTDSHVEKSLSTINQEANKLTTLINTLLDFSRLQTGKFSLDKQQFSLIEVCKQHIMVMQALNPHHTFTFKSQLQKATVTADRIRIEQVLTNLLTNAARYSPENTTIALGLQKKDNHYILSVKDEGQGIDEIFQKRIFEPFFQEKEDGKESIHGMGLGLYISHEIVTKHKGTLWVESQKGLGSTFYMSIPTTLHKK